VALTKSFKELVRRRVASDAAFAENLLREGINTMLAAGDGGVDVACIARNVVPRDNPPVYCVQDSRYDSIIPANPNCTH
jgi:hypothetical protein